ncbi:MAG TPA: hypothetical protein VIQ97_03955 [Prevotella sp.]
MNLEEKIQYELRHYLAGMGQLEERMPECPDVEQRWPVLAEAYLPDGVREFNAYPMVSLGWMMFLGMAMAKFWDEDWAKYEKMENLYERIRDARGFDCMDEYILEEVLKLDAEAQLSANRMVSECAQRTHDLLLHEAIEPGTAEAFRAYVACLHQLYLLGMALQLHAMGYRMTAIG